MGCFNCMHSGYPGCTVFTWYYTLCNQCNHSVVKTTNLEEVTPVSVKKHVITTTI